MNLNENPHLNEHNIYFIKFFVLLWLTFQNSIHTLLLRYSRARNVPEMFYSSVAVFWMEIVKSLFCLFMIVFQKKCFFRQTFYNKIFIIINFFFLEY